MTPGKFLVRAPHDWKPVGDHARALEYQRPKLDKEGQTVKTDDGQTVMEGVAYCVTVEEIKATRSLEQNARWWALMTAISQQAPAHMGGEWWDPELWHEHLVRRFAGLEAGPFGEGVRKRTSKMRVAQFGKLMEEVEAWAYDQFPGFTFEREAA